MSAFKAVYVQKLDFPLMCSMKKTCKCWTVAECMKITNDSEFKVYCSEHYCVDSDDDLQHHADEDNSGYFSDEELPPDEMDEVSNDWFNAHLMDGTAVITPN